MSKSNGILAWTCALVAAVALSPVLIMARDAPSLPRSEDIIHNLVERAKAWKERDQDEEKQLAYSERVVTNKLQADGALKDREEKVYQVAPVKGESIPKLIQKNGKPPSPSDLKEEEARLRKKREASQKRKASEPENAIELNEELVGKYDFEMAGEEVVEGRPVYLLTFQPKSHNLPVRRKIDYVLNRMAGKVWVDQEDYEIAKANMRLTESAQLWWGVIASLRRFSAALEQTRLSDGCWFLKHLDSTIDARFLLTTVHQKQEMWLSDFKKGDL
ncbi:MAG: hypothetical protein ACLQVM_11640 [Terriglobia bacterium]